MKNVPSIITSANSAEKVIRPYVNGLDHEEVWGIFLTASKSILAIEKLSMGTLTSTAIDCRTVIRKALLINAACMVLVHNHLSANPLPSKADIEFTKKLQAACILMDTRLLDHIILAEKLFYSFAEERTITL